MNKEVELKELKALLYVLENVIDGSNLDTSRGICSNVRRRLRCLNIVDALYFHDTFNEFIDANKNSYWYSGSPLYPISDVDNLSLNGVHMYDNAVKKGTLWVGKYGDTRRLVLDKYYEYLEKRLEALTRKSMWQRLTAWYRGL